MYKPWLVHILNFREDSADCTGFSEKNGVRHNWFGSGLEIASHIPQVMKPGLLTSF